MHYLTLIVLLSGWTYTAALTLRRARADAVN